MRILSTTFFILLATTAFAKPKIVSVKAQNQGIVQMKGWLATIATNRIIGCYNWVLDDGAPAYVANTKDIEMEATITESEISFEIDVSKKGFCQFKPEYLVFNTSSIGEGRTVFGVAITDKDLPKDNDTFTHVLLRDVDVFECKYQGQYRALNCEVVMKDGRRLDRNGLGIYINTKTDKQPIVFKFAVN